MGPYSGRSGISPRSNRSLRVGAETAINAGGLDARRLPQFPNDNKPRNEVDVEVKVGVPYTKVC